ncbi:DUF1622 domain-containing protein [Salinimicrobium soli]|uniref:DUF1622 domain-containing protein n=1 Tax=Salinimicrobium soli TaxID=1254399 RepID=UPI003AABE709
MIDGYSQIIEQIAKGIELAGIATIVIGAFIALGRYLFAKHPEGRDFSTLRHDLGKAILLGLEFLVAGDIIATVTVDPTMDQVMILGLIVLIRTFLSFSLEVELEGQWPWQKKRKKYENKSF